MSLSLASIMIASRSRCYGGFIFLDSAKLCQAAVRDQHKSLLFLAYAVGLNSGNLESFKSVNFNYVLVLTISLYYSLEPDTC